MSLARRICVLAFVACLGISTARAAAPIPRLWSKQGPVPTAAEAIAIAVKLWSPIYGTDKVAREKPYHASLERGVWTVQGSVPRRAAGGAAILRIRKSDGEVLLLSHFK